MASTVKRQSAAVMVTDIAGYTSIMASDEEKELSLLQDKRKILKPLIKQHDGVYVKGTCDEVGLGNKTRLHYLRHTFMVMEWLRSGDIYLIFKKLEHSSVTTTEIYTKFELCQLREDFPSLTRKLGDGGQFLVGNHSIGYNYGKA